jgi:hypothetical protein
MDHHRFRPLTHMPSRRDVLRGLTGTAISLTSLRSPNTSEARKKRKHKRKRDKLQRNEFGCVDVGGNCLGDSVNCCSGICDGRKPKQGKKDSSVCVAHDTAGICFADSDTCTVGLDVYCNADNDHCFCFLTTGNVGFCGDFEVASGSDSICRDCAKDTDCQDEFGPGAACVFLGAACSANCPDTGRTACLRPCTAGAP